MNQEQQIQQLKDAIDTCELMILEQSKLVVSLNMKVESQLEEMQKEKKLREKDKQLFTFEKEELSATWKNERQILIEKQRNALDDVIKINEQFESYKKKAEDEIKEKQKEIQSLMNKCKQIDKMNEALSQTVKELENLLIESKITIATQGGKLDEAKKEVIILKKAELENEIKKSASEQNGNGFIFSQSSIIRSDKSVLREIEPNFKSSSIKQNQIFLRNIQNMLSKQIETDNISPEAILNTQINQGHAFFPNESPIFQKIDTNSPDIKEQATLPDSDGSTDRNQNNLSNYSSAISPVQQNQIDSYCEYLVGRKIINVILQEPPQTDLVFSEEDQIQFDKVFTENENSSAKKEYYAELNPLLNATFLYSEYKNEAILKKAQILLKKGSLPQSLRKNIWPQLIGNKLKISKKSYKNLDEQMKVLPISPKTSNIIMEDMHRTFPRLQIFDKGTKVNLALQKILEQYHYFRSDMGYVQGMAYPASILYLNLGDSYLTFKYLSNLIAGSNFLTNLYRFKLPKIKVYLATFDYFLSQKQPNCMKHITKLGISSDIYLVEWFYTLYCRAFSMSTVNKIWDLMLTYGEITFYRVGIAIFQCIEKELIDKNFDETLFLIRNCTSKIDSEQILKIIYSSKITTEQMLKMYTKYTEDPSLTKSMLKGHSPQKNEKKGDSPELKSEVNNHQEIKKVNESKENGGSYTSHILHLEPIQMNSDQTIDSDQQREEVNQDMNSNGVEVVNKDSSPNTNNYLNGNNESQELNDFPLNQN